MAWKQARKASTTKTKPTRKKNCVPVKEQQELLDQPPAIGQAEATLELVELQLVQGPVRRP